MELNLSIKTNNKKYGDNIIPFLLLINKGYLRLI